MNKSNILLSLALVSSACLVGCTPSSDGDSSTNAASLSSSGNVTGSSDSDDAAFSSSGPTSAHDHQYAAVVTDPTCTEKGYTTYTCSCGESYIDDYVDALGHDTVQHDAKEATCAEAGWNAYETCTRCDYTTYEEIPASGEHTYVDGVCTVCGNIRPGATYEFGRYPQKRITDTAVISRLSKATDSDNDGYIEYGVKEYLRILGSEGKKTWNNSAGEFLPVYDASTEYYFEVEPLTWKYYDGMLICNKIIDSEVFYAGGSSRSDGEDTIYGNNYMYSTVRAFLNGYDGTDYNVDDFTGKGFIDMAFTAEEQEKILTTTVDNSPASTGNSTNIYACADTEDKIFLLSYADTLNADYGFSTTWDNSTTRTKYATSYAFFKGVTTVTNESPGEWLLRSPFYDGSRSVGGVDSYGGTAPNGELAYDASGNGGGIVPALRITL